MNVVAFPLNRAVAFADDFVPDLEEPPVTVVSLPENLPLTDRDRQLEDLRRSIRKAIYRDGFEIKRPGPTRLFGINREQILRSLASEFGGISEISSLASDLECDGTVETIGDAITHPATGAQVVLHAIRIAARKAEKRKSMAVTFGDVFDAFDAYAFTWDRSNETPDRRERRFVVAELRIERCIRSFRFDGLLGSSGDLFWLTDKGRTFRWQ